jgi:hypothetical protein
MRSVDRWLLIPLLNLLLCVPVFADCPSTDSSSYKVLASGRDQLLIADHPAERLIQTSGEISLQSGSLLVRVNAPVTISTPLCRTRLSKRAVVLIKVTDSSVSITNLADYKRGSVSVIAGRLVLPLESTSQVVFTKCRPGMPDVFDVPKVGRRSMLSRNISGLGWITTAEVSLVDSLAREPLLIAVRTKGTSVAEKAMLHQLIKLAATVQIVFRNKGHFLQRSA